MSLVIKENCWKWETPKGIYFMKYYEDAFTAQKVKIIHQQLEHIQFPFHLHTEPNEDMHIFKQHWYEGTSANYRFVDDQRATLTALEALHATSEKIAWQDTRILPYYELREKWHRRFERFTEQEQPLKQLLQGNYEKIVTMASRALHQIDCTRIKKEPVTLLHGDVVHHNFMIGDDGVKLVDFDLASLGQKTDELILWMHRVLPNTQYDVKQLFEAHPYLQQVRGKLHYLRFPNEVMREALFYLKLNPRQKQACYPFIQSIVNEVIYNEEKLVAEIEALQA